MSEAHYTHGAAVSPSDSVALASVARALWIGGTGDVCLVTVGGETITILAVPAGTLLPIYTAKVKATDTHATSIVALW